jgi:hypothetical protein
MSASGAVSAGGQTAGVAAGAPPNSRTMSASGAVSAGGQTAGVAAGAPPRPAALGQITPFGNAPNTISGKDVAVECFNKFNESVGRNKLVDMSANDFCDKERLYEFANFLVNTYEKQDGAGGNLAMNSAKQYMGRVMGVARKVFEDVNPLFFIGLDVATPSDHWYKKMLRNMEKESARNAIENGEKITNSATAIGRTVVMAICAAYFLAAMEGSLFQEALYRRFLVVLIFVVCGRSGEAVTLSWSLITWDAELRTVYFNWSQIKTGKQKGLQAFPDFESHLMDFYKAFGDLLMTGYFNRVVLVEGSDSSADWIFPSLVNLRAGCARVLSSILQDLTPSSKTLKYRAYKVSILPNDVTGTSLRSGAINQMGAMGVFPHLRALVSGHDMRYESALWDYGYQTTSDTAPGEL